MVKSNMHGHNKDHVAAVKGVVYNLQGQDWHPVVGIHCCSRFQGHSWKEEVPVHLDFQVHTQGHSNQDHHLHHNRVDRHDDHQGHAGADHHHRHSHCREESQDIP